MKYRIAIQLYDENGKPSEFRNVMIDTEKDIDTIKNGVIAKFSSAYNRWLQPFLRLLNDRHSKSSFFERHGLGTDLFDHEAVGKDISAEDFVENEIFFELEEARGHR